MPLQNTGEAGLRDRAVAGCSQQGMVSAAHMSSLLWGWTLTALGDISLVGNGKSQEEKRRRKRERGGDEERGRRRGGGERERTGAQGSSCLQLTAGERAFVGL